MKLSLDALHLLNGLIEQVGRTSKNVRIDVLKCIGEKGVKKILELHDILHCLPLERLAIETIEEYNIPTGNFDNIKYAEEREEFIPLPYSIGMTISMALMRYEPTMDGIYDILLKTYNSKVIQRMAYYDNDLFTVNSSYLFACIEDNCIYEV